MSKKINNVEINTTSFTRNSQGTNVIPSIIIDILDNTQQLGPKTNLTVSLKQDKLVITCPQNLSNLFDVKESVQKRTTNVKNTTLDELTITLNKTELKIVKNTLVNGEKLKSFYRRLMDLHGTQNLCSLLKSITPFTINNIPVFVTDYSKKCFRAHVLNGSTISHTDCVELIIIKNTKTSKTTTHARIFTYGSKYMETEIARIKTNIDCIFQTNSVTSKQTRN